MVGYARRNHMVQIPHFPGWDAFNADLEGHCRARQAARTHDGGFTEVDAGAALQQLDPLWDELFPAEQARIVALLVERVDISTDGG